MSTAFFPTLHASKSENRIGGHGASTIELSEVAFVRKKCHMFGQSDFFTYLCIFK